MSVHKPVTMTILKRSTQRLKTKDGYKFTPQGRWAFAQRWAWRFLQKTHALASAYDDKTTETRLKFDGRRALDAIYAARSDAFNLGYRPSKVLIGPDDFAEIMRDNAYLDIGFSRGLAFTGQLGAGNRLFDLPVEVIPHMSGVLVL